MNQATTHLVDSDKDSLFIFSKASHTKISDQNIEYLFFSLEEPPNSIPPTWTFTLQFVIVRYPSILFHMRLHKLLCVIGVWSIYNLNFSRRIDTLCLLENWLSRIRFLRNHICIMFLVGFQVGISLVYYRRLYLHTYGQGMVGLDSSLWILDFV